MTRGAMKTAWSKAMKRIVVAAIVAVFAVALVGSGAWPFPNFGTSETPESITIGILPVEASGLLYIAEDQGYFTQNGLNVTLQDYDNGAATLDGLQRGDVDMALAAEYPLVVMAFNGSQIKIIGCVDRYEYFYLIGRKDRGIVNISDIRGKKIGLPFKTAVEFNLGRFLDLRGMKMSDVTVVNMNVSQSWDVLEAGTVDAIVSWSPYAEIARDHLGSDATVWPVQNSQPSYALVNCRDAWIAENPGPINRFLKALDEANVYAMGYPTEAKGIIKKRLNYTDEQVETAWKRNQYSLSLDQSLITAMEDEGRWMIKNNLTSAEKIPDFLEYIYTKGLEEVKPGSVNIIS